MFYRSRPSVSKKHTSVRKRSRLQESFIYFVLFLVVIGLVAGPLAKGALFYQSYWGGAVFVPFVLVAAATIIVAVVKNWKRK